VHVAQLAGLPRSVTVRAREILEELESQRDAKPRTRRTEASAQLQLLNADDGLKRELSELDIDGMTPLQAMTKLYEFVERAREGGG
jgi:DNA mismatch repair protein MutS